MTSQPPRGAGPEASHPAEIPESVPIEAVKLRHPWRAVFATILVILAALFIYDAATNRPAFDWPMVGQYLFDHRIISAIGYTLQLTVYSMVIAIVLGVTLAVMRLSPNPVFRSVAWVYLWIFRGTPIYVQLTFWGLVGVIYKTIDIGIPFTEPWVQFDTRDLLSYFALAVIGLALNEAAYMAEIVRAGLAAVDKGQEEAAQALGLGWGHTMTRVILPQAMRVIIPPTGNEVISMLKTTSLVIAVPFTLELYTRARDIAAVTYKPVPMFIVASIWYLVITSILMVGQYYLEKHYSKGIGDRREVTKPSAATGALPVPGTAARGAQGDGEGPAVGAPGEKG